MPCEPAHTAPPLAIAELLINWVFTNDNVPFVKAIAPYPDKALLSVKFEFEILTSASIASITDPDEASTLLEWYKQLSIDSLDPNSSESEFGSSESDT